jgi:hypothetical protein
MSSQNIISIIKFGFMGCFCFMSLVSRAEEQALSRENASVTYKVGRATYMVKRIQEHQPHIKSVNVAVKCGSSKIWMRHFYKFGMCEVAAADFNPKSKQLKIKYFSHDLKTGDNYLCENTSKYLEIDLPDSCRPK